MANYNTTKASIDTNVIPYNNAQLITGEKMNSVLKEIVDNMGGQGYLFKGIASPSDPAITTDARVFFFATTPGTYTNKGGVVVNSGELAIITYDTIWNKSVVCYGLTSTELAKLQDLPTNAELTALIEGQVVISNHELVIGNSPSGIKVPEGYEFIGIAHPGDAAVTHYNKVFYLAYEAGTYTNKGGLLKERNTLSVLMYDGSTWSMQEVESKFSPIILPSRTANAYVTTSSKWASHNPCNGIFLSVKAGERYLLKAKDALYAVYSLLTSNSFSLGASVTTFVTGTGRNTIPEGEERIITIPEGCNFLQLNGNYDENDYMPLVYSDSAIDIGEFAENVENSFKNIFSPIDLDSLTIYSRSITNGLKYSSNVNSKRAAIKCVPGQAFYIVGDEYQSTDLLWVRTENPDAVSTTSADVSLTPGYGTRIPLSAQEIKILVAPPDANYLNINTIISNSGVLKDVTPSFIGQLFGDSIDILKGESIKNSGVVVGGGSSFVRSRYFVLDANCAYRVILGNNNYSSQATSQNYKFGIYGIDAQGVSHSIILRNGTSEIPNFIDFETNDEYVSYQIGIRANVGETLYFTFVKAEALNVSDATSILSLNPDSEWIPKMQSAKKRYYTSTDTTEKLPIVIAHLSDIHGNWENVSRFLEWTEHHISNIDIRINTGDTVPSQFSDGISGYDAISGVENIVNIIGNHDTRGADDWQAYAGTQDAYNRYYANVASWGVVQPSGIGVNNYYPCYCYKDYEDRKLRMVFVDVMAYDATEDSWLQSVLADAIANEYHIVIAAHMAGFMPNNSDITSEHINCNWTSLYGRTPITAQQTNGYNPYAYHMIESVDDFIADGGNFVGYLCGHSHYDYVAKKGAGNKQWIFTIGASKYGEMRDYKHILGTRSQDEFQIVSIDTHLGIIKLFKVGANVDLYGRHKNSICIDYINHAIIAESF